MYTFQDFMQIGETEDERMDFITEAIQQHKASDLYNDAVIAEQYMKKRNVTIMNYQRLLTTLTGNKVIDRWSPNHKVVSGFFKRFVTQQNQFLLGNGVTWEGDGLGDKFDNALREAGKDALVGAVSFGFWNLDHMDVFKITEFVPLWDEENGALRAGIRWWQIDDNKPLRATLYEEDGYTEYMWKEGDKYIIAEKKAYIINYTTSEVDGTEIIDGQNYPAFPIVPLWGNPEHQSELVGIREGIDEYDFIKNGFANDLDGAQLYWIIKGAGGMNDPDLVQFLERLALVHAAAPADGQEVEAKTIEIPYAARDTLLNRIEKDLYRDYMALNTEELSSRNATATEIKAAYEPMNAKADDYEYQILDFLEAIMELAGVDDTPTFTRSYLINTQEEITTVVAAANYLQGDYVTEKILTLLGDGDKAEEMVMQMEADDLNLDKEDNVNG